jgi:hypothetical protein
LFGASLCASVGVVTQKIRERGPSRRRGQELWVVVGRWPLIGVSVVGCRTCANGFEKSNEKTLVSLTKKTKATEGPNDGSQSFGPSASVLLLK